MENTGLKYSSNSVPGGYTWASDDCSAPKRRADGVEKYCDSPDHDRNQLQVQVKPIRAIDRNKQFQGGEPLETDSLQEPVLCSHP